MSRSLQTGVAYHGNRMPSHVRADMAEIARADMDIVVHMLSHTDWERHKNVMKDIIAITEDAGLEVWVDNWGIGGSPGDVSHFLAYYPDSHMVYSNGQMHPFQACLNSRDYRRFVKEWLDIVAEIGGKTVFWDEPHIPTKKITEDERIFCCCCPTCKKLFEEKYGHPMPTVLTPEVEEFRTDSIIDYFREVTEYANSLGFYNTSCIMPGVGHGISLESVGKLAELPYMQSIGYDPYWYNRPGANAYEYVYNGTKQAIEISNSFGKHHNIWIQTYKVPRGREEEIIEGTAAAYDAGARCILAWGYKGSESNNYRAENPERTWAMTVEAMRRIRSVERDRIWAENRKKYQ